MGRAIRFLERLNSQTTRFAGYAATGLLMAMLGVLVVHVFYRYVVGSSFVWTEELSRMLMVWMAFLFFPTAHRKGLNVSLDALAASIENTALYRWVGLVIEAAILVLLCGAAYYSFNIALGAATSETLAMRLPLIYVYAIMPIGFALVALCSLERLLRFAGNIGHPGRYEIHAFGSSVDTGA